MLEVFPSREKAVKSPLRLSLREPEIRPSKTGVINLKSIVVILIVLKKIYLMVVCLGL